MQHVVFAVVLTVFFVLGSRPAFATTVEAARSAEDAGHWSEAVQLWQDIVNESADASAVVRQKRLASYLQALHAVGEWKQLEEAASSAGEIFPGWEPAAVFLSRSLAARGSAQQADAVLAGLNQPSPFSQAERLRLLTVLGRRDEAGSLASAMIAAYSASASYPPHHLLAFGHAARLRGDYKGAARMYELAYTDSVGYLDARLSLAYLFREKFQANLAADELNAAGRIAPHHPDVLLAVARLSLEGNNLPAAEKAAQELLTMRPEDGEAPTILAWLDLIADLPEDAKKEAGVVLKRNPLDREARTVLAAAAYLEGDSAAYHRETETILKQDPGYLDVHLDLGNLLEKSRRNAEAIAMYARVLAREPKNPHALIATGLLLMREGEEAAARGYLESGFEGDPFNIRAYNQLQLLDTMETFRTYTTEHFEIRLDAAADSLLVPLMTQRLESIYDDLVDRHGWEPDRTTIVEVFPSHDWFSARVTGLPWIGGIPAVCFGHVVAMDSPRTLSGTVNWEDILRHEFGHVLALGMTDKKVPFWFTEGLSVYLEAYPRGASWDENLKAAHVDGQLIPVDSLTIGFTRPKHFSQRLLAYHESGLIVGDIVARHGWEAIPKLLHAFRDGAGWDGAVREVLKEDPDTFARRALQVVRETAEAVPLWPTASKERLARLSAVEGKAAKRTEHLQLLAVTQLQLRLFDEAAETAQALLKKDERNPVAQGVLGLVAKNNKQTTEAMSHWKAALEQGSTDLPVHHAYAAAELAAGDTGQALLAYEAILKVYPLDVPARLQRARLFSMGKDVSAAREEYQLLLRQTGEAGAAAVDLARLELQAGSGEAAARALNYATSVLPLEADVEALRGQAYLLLDRDKEAYDLFVLARRLNLRSIESMVGMAGYYLKQGDYEEAAYFAELALKYDPDHPVAKDVLIRARAG